MEHAVRTIDLRKKYKDFQALSGLNMSVPAGSIYGLVGPNGAGKTTLLRILCGLQTQTAGTYVLLGCSDKSDDILSARAKMGAVIETPAIYSHMTAKENLVHQCILTGARVNTANQLLALVGLEETGRKKVGNFSLGMKQRLGIAIALVNDPTLLILDEPMNGLDPTGVLDIRNLILKLNRERKITIIISSHILDELAKVATHYGFIDNGHMIRELSESELPQGNLEGAYFELIGGRKFEQ